MNTNTNTQQKILSSDQKLLIAAFSATYNIEPEEITFFSDDPRPFFSYEATCVLLNRLTDVTGIDIEPVANGFVDSVGFRVTLSREGRQHSAIGIANIKETLDGVVLNEAQLNQMASGRAMRSVLRVAGIDLLKLHNLARLNAAMPAEAPKSNYTTLLAQAHVLGQEAGLIIGNDKTAWITILGNRYGVYASNELTEDSLADFVAVLKTLVPQQKAAA